MSVVIVGGNDKMIRQYEDLCKNYKCKAKVFTQPSSNLREKIGRPDLMILFTNNCMSQDDCEQLLRLLVKIIIEIARYTYVLVANSI